MADAVEARRVTGHLKLVDRREGPVWYIKSRVPGRRPEQTTRRLAPAHLRGGKPPRGHLTRKQAEDALGDLLAKERARVGEGAYDYQPEGATFGEIAAALLHHLETVKKREPSTLHDYRGSLNKYLRRWEDRPAVSIRTLEVEELRDELLAAGLAPRTVCRHLNVAYAVFKFGKRKHGLTHNPADSDLVDRPTVNYTGEFETLTVGEELPALIRAARDPRDAALFITAAMTGLRQSELLALRWRDIDFANQRIHSRRSFSYRLKREKARKGNKVVSVPLVDELVPWLDALSRREYFTGPDDLVFGNEVGEHLNHWSLRDRYHRALRRAGVRRVRFHDLRHLFGSTAVKEFPLSDVQAMMGHAHITTTMRYVHHRPGADDAAKLSRAFKAGALPESFIERGADRVPN